MRSGVTVVELLVVLAILALTSSLASVALRRADSTRDVDAGDQVLTLRRDAIATGHSITRVVRRDSASFIVTALADGRIVADAALGIDPSTGLRHATTP